MSSRETPGDPQNPTIGIVGCGGIGLAAAVDLIHRGFSVRCMVEIDVQTLDTLRAVETLTSTGAFGTLSYARPPVSDDTASLAGCDLILVATTADRHVQVAGQIGGRIDPDATVVLATGYVGGSRVFQRGLAAAPQAGSAAPGIVELNSSPYLSFVHGPGAVHVAGIKQVLEAGSSDVNLPPVHGRRVASVYPQARWVSDTLASGLNNPNPTAHVPPTLLSHGWSHERERRGRGVFYLADYNDDGAARLRVAMEAERRQVMDSIGLGDTFMTREKFAALVYPPGSREAEPPIMGPDFLPRFLTEDVPCGLVPIESLAEKAAVSVPTTTALITIASDLTGIEWRAQGRTAADVLP